MINSINSNITRPIYRSYNIQGTQPITSSPEGDDNLSSTFPSQSETSPFYEPYKVELSGNSTENNKPAFNPTYKKPSVRPIEEPDNSSIETNSKNSDSNSDTDELSVEEKKEVQELKQIDTEVKNHEAAHKAAAGGLSVKSASFGYTIGPDGKRYATSGEVSIDTSIVPDDPDATILKMQTVQRAALAPAEPSGQDRKVASQAARAEAQARSEKVSQEQENIRPEKNSDSKEIESEIIDNTQKST